MAPSAPPAPTSVCNSSINRIVFLARRTSFITALIRSSNWPRYFVPATIIARSSTTTRLSRSSSGTLLSTTIWAKPSTMAVLPTPASPKQHGVVLLPAAEDLDDALDLALATDHRVELALSGQLGQVAAEAVESRRLAFAGLLLRRPCLARPSRRLRARGRAGSGLPRGRLRASFPGSSTPGRRRLPVRGAGPAAGVRCRRSYG